MVLGGLFLILGVLGIVLPGLPTTPFLLLTSYFLVRSSPGLNARLLRSRLFGPILIDWQVHGGIRPHVRLKAIGTVLLAVALTLFLTQSSSAISLGILVAASIGMLVILRLPTARNSPSEKMSDLDRLRR